MSSVRGKNIQAAGHDEVGANWPAARGVAIAAVVLIAASASIGHAQAGGRAQRAATSPAASAPVDHVEITPVDGPSTLHHLGLTIEQSSMGWTGQFAVSPPPPLTRLTGEQQLTRPFVMTGADLYRVSCRACHKADGSGSPPEINSILGPVRSASVEWETDRMKQLGRPADPKFVRDLATQSQADLLKRLKAGGHNMPSFGHLSDDEIAVLRGYLDQLAGLPQAAHEQRELTVPAVRVGELIIKGTCHVCHDATAASYKPTTVLSGVIPPLAQMTHQKTIYDFVQKVIKGAPVPLSAGGVSSRGRMPVFNYLTDREVAEAYIYLIMYPPR